MSDTQMAQAGSHLDESTDFPYSRWRKAGAWSLPSLAACCVAVLLSACVNVPTLPEQPVSATEQSGGAAVDEESGINDAPLATESPTTGQQGSPTPGSTSIPDAQTALSTAAGLTPQAIPTEEPAGQPTIEPGDEGGDESTEQTTGTAPLGGLGVVPEESTRAATPMTVTLPTATPDLPVILLPTATPAPLPVALPTATPGLNPVVQVRARVNVRSGPGTNYPVLTTLDVGEQLPVTGRNPASDWWQVRLAGSSANTGWLYAPLVDMESDSSTVAIVADIPAPPTAAPLPTSAPVAVASAEVAATLPAQDAAPANTPAPVSGGPDFRVIGKRLWDVYENGGSLDGPSVTCGEKRQLLVVVLDAQGNRLNGVAVQAEYGAREIFVTGSQGKGDGQAEFVLGGGQNVRVIRDTDGREVSSEWATGLSTDPANIPFEYLIAGQYCTDEDSCRRFAEAPGCWGHYSWTVTFQRNY